MRSRVVARAALVLLCGNCLLLGVLASFAPRTFYDDFPFISHWVERLPPYNEHLVSDVGGLYLGFALIFALAAWRLQRELVLAVSAGFIVVAGLHLIFHASHLANFGTVDGAAEIATLASLLIPPLLAIWASSEGSAAPDEVL